MKPCPRSGEIQDYLDGELSEHESLALRRHAEACAECAGEIATYSRMFRVLERQVVYAAPPALTERVLDQVLPSRIRRRWVATVGWSYAAAFAVCLVTVAVLLAQPDSRTVLAGWSGELSSRLVHAIAFVLNTVSFAVVNLASGWGMVAALGARLAPLGRAMGILLANPAVLVSLAMAAAAFAALLWWLKPKGKHANQEARHVGVLVF